MEFRTEHSGTVWEKEEEAEEEAEDRMEESLF